ncbi:hypothetical protein [Serratia sp. PL7]|uniref:hypothetical protein n=1 Tax=Serratia sp. PL7 TaxID=2952201 RepID=UPI0021AD649A|nr:hypothetical protein [Serratia sp. PL7]
MRSKLKNLVFVTMLTAFWSTGSAAYPTMEHSGAGTISVGPWNLVDNTKTIFPYCIYQRTVKRGGKVIRIEEKATYQSFLVCRQP